MYIKQIALLFLCISYCFIGIGQSLHTPSEIVSIMERSKLSYQIDELDKTTFKTVPNQAIERGILVQNANGMGLKPYPISKHKEYIKNKKKGDSKFKSKKYKKAIKFYKRAMNEYPEDILLLLKIGESYNNKKQYKEALKWYDKAKKINDYDFEIYRLTAESLLKQKKFERAKQQIVTAHLLNRNDVSLKNRMIEILSKQSIPYKDWTMIPQYKLAKNRNKVDIRYGNAVWLAYSAVIALWKYEAGYKESMEKISNKTAEIIMIKEALLNALIVYENESIKVDKEPAFELLGKVIDGKHLDNFILYELIGVENPIRLCALPSESLKSLVEYITEIRK